jgi:hypothetical protein
MFKEFDGPNPKHHRARALDLELPVDEYIGDLGNNLSVTAWGKSLLLVAAHEDETKLAVNIRNDLFEM